MNYSQHIAAAETFLQAEELLSAAAMDMAAAEMLWGAAVQVIDAVSHRAGGRHPANNRARLQVVGQVESMHRIAGELSDGFKTRISVLHNHFYTGQIGLRDLPVYLNGGREFVNRMLDLTDREIRNERE